MGQTSDSKIDSKISNFSFTNPIMVKMDSFPHVDLLVEIPPELATELTNSLQIDLLHLRTNNKDLIYVQ